MMPESADPIGYVAASLVVATFYMRSMTALRLFGLGSNIAFILYAFLAELPPVLLLHLLLLPLNLIRLAEAMPTRHWTQRARAIAGRRRQTTR